MYRALLALVPILGTLSLYADGSEDEATLRSLEKLSSIKTFTGKIIGSSVRMRANADLESPIISELSKNNLVLVTGEKNDFYIVKPPQNIKAYIFRTYVIDDVVEGNRVNIRLAPDREAPVIGQLSTGDAISGLICEGNTKWMEIPAPESTRFYIAKELIEYAGNEEMKGIYDTKLVKVNQILESTALLIQAEFRKPFNEIDSNRLAGNYETVINDYKDFPEHVKKAEKALTSFRENYLQRKIAYLEEKANRSLNGYPPRDQVVATAPVTKTEQPVTVTSTDRMKVWEPVEQSLYLVWSAMHHAKNMTDFYDDQKLKGKTVSGILEAFSEPVKKKPGDFILKENDLPVAYIYSTQVDLNKFIGKHVSLTVSERPNNNFAFPAFYALDAD